MCQYPWLLAVIICTLGGTWCATGSSEEMKIHCHHPRTYFISMCFGQTYYDEFCGPMLESFAEAYSPCRKEGGETHSWIILHSDLLPRQLDNTFALLSSAGFNCDLHHVDAATLESFWKGTMPSTNYLDEVGTEKKQSMILNNVINQQLVLQKLLSEKDFPTYGIIIDSDTLFVRGLGTYLPWEHADWDVAITHYDPSMPNHLSPSTYLRINAGVVLLNFRRSTDVVLEFLNEWAHRSLIIATEITQKPLIKEFRSPNQAALATFLWMHFGEGLFDFPSIYECKVCGAPVNVTLSVAVPHLNMRLRSFPASHINYAESLPEIGPEVRIIHLKGSWWHTAVKYWKAPESLNYPDRSAETEAAAWALWLRHFYAWKGRPQAHVLEGATIK